MTTGLREFTGWARLKMLNGLQEQRNVVKLNDAMVAAEMKKSFGDGFEMKKDDEMLVGRDFVQPNAQPIVIMPPAPVAPVPQSNAGWIVAILLAFLLLLLASIGGAWWLLSQRPATTVVSPPPSVQTDGYDIKLFTP
jgi:hypothetical protein